MKSLDRSSPARITASYAVGATLWILLSDLLVGRFVEATDAVVQWQSLKGLGFVAITSALLYGSLDFERRRLARVQAARRLDRELIRLLSTYVRDVVYRFRLGADRACAYVSPSIEELTGTRPDEHYADPELSRHIVHEDDRERAERALSEPDGEPELIRWRHRDGRMVWVEQRNVPIRDANGRLVAVEGIARDVTALQRVNVELDRTLRAEEKARARLTTLSRRLIEAQETERRNIARELHDEFGQVLSAIRFGLRAALDREAERGEASPELREANVQIDRLFENVRSLSLSLRPTLLDDLGLVPAVEWLAQRVQESSGVPVRVDARIDDTARLTSITCTTAYRIVQESLTNATRHAGAAQVEVVLREEGDQLVVEIVDDGHGFDVDRALRRAGQGESMGLLSILERADLAGGRAAFDSDLEGTGTRIRAWLPLSTRD